MEFAFSVVGAEFEFEVFKFSADEFKFFEVFKFSADELRFFAEVEFKFAEVEFEFPESIFELPEVEVEVELETTEVELVESVEEEELRAVSSSACGLLWDGELASVGCNNKNINL